MIIIIDAYNLLRSVPPYKKSISDQEKKSFVVQLNRYAQRKNHKIILVFDGGPYQWPFKDRNKRMTIVYSGSNESADDYIKNYCDSHRSQDILLVSSDTDLNQHANRLHIPSIDSQQFHQIVCQELKIQKHTVPKNKDNSLTILHDNTKDIDQLMIEASKNVFLKAEDFVAESKKRVSTQSQLTKQERILLKKLNKL